MQENLSIAIPDGIPMPRFLPFQRVRLKTKMPDNKRLKIGMVVGFEYTTPTIALNMGWKVGWDYIVDWFYETPDGEIIGICEVREILTEKCLELVESQSDRPHQPTQQGNQDEE